VLVSSGHLGVIYSVTLQCVEDYNVIVHTHTFPVQKLNGKITNLMQSTPSLVLLISEDSFALIKTLHPISTALAPPTLNLFDFVSEFVDECFAISVNELNTERFWWKYRLGSFFLYMLRYPLFTQLMTKERTKVMTWDGGETFVRVWKDRAFASYEFQVPVEYADKARSLFLKRIQEFRKSGVYDRHGPIALRNTKQDTRGFLSPTKGNSSMYVSFDIPYQKMDENEISFYKVIEEDLIGLGARLSWSRNGHLPASKILESFPEAEKFVEAIGELDPHGIFSNGLRKRFFGK